MKNIIKSTLMLLLGVGVFTACSDDLDNNPVLKMPDSFTLNTPSYADLNTDLATTSSLAFSWSQPDYGFPAAAEYQLQVSLDGNFTTSVEEAEADEEGTTVADYATLDNVFTEVQGSVPAADVAKALQKIAKWEQEDVPATQTIYVRALAFYASRIIYSNTVTLNVLPYYVELADAAIETWWLLGSDIADGNWGTTIGVSTIPMMPIEGYEYNKKTGQGQIHWIGFLMGNGFKLRGDLNDGWATQWGQGDSFGTYVKNDGGSGNITVPEPGLYQVILDTEKDNLMVAAFDGPAPVFDGMCISGSFNDWGDEPMNPCSTAFENHDWYLDYTFAAGDEVKFKQPGSWDYNKGGVLVKDGDGFYGFGVGGGPNYAIPVAGTYTIIFNDITGTCRFILK